MDPARGGAAASECPAAPSSSLVLEKDEIINPLNNMAKSPSQEPWPSQKMPLDTERVLSTIPRGKSVPTDNSEASNNNVPPHQRDVADSDVWVYPSQQQFFNAMKRRGWAEGAQEEDMSVVVAIHNAVNERAWK